MADPPEGVEAGPLEHLGHDPDDLYMFAFWAYHQADDGIPQLIWSREGGAHLPHANMLELADHLERYAESLRASYWQYQQQWEEDDDPLIEGGRMYE